MKQKHPVRHNPPEPPRSPVAPAESEDPVTQPPVIPPDTEPEENG